MPSSSKTPELPHLPEPAPESAGGASADTRVDVRPAVRSNLPVRLPGMAQSTVVRGSKLGDRYTRVRISPHREEFRQTGTGTFEATAEVLQPRTPGGRLAAGTKRFLIGERIPTSAEIHERLTKVKALAVLSSDAISSVAYATEASLSILVAASVGAAHLNVYIGLAIAVLIFIVGTSYQQTIHAYPHGGGSYIVARDNLGDLPGLIAAAALLIDYVLTVSVSIAAGVDALTSAVPSLRSANVALGVLFILLIMIVNLRGIRESGSIFAAPTYVFIGCFAIMIATGVIHAALMPGGLTTPIPITAASIRHNGWDPTGQVSLLLVLTAFASGCSAMTGTEAISNGVPAFKPPESKNAARTLLAMVLILAGFFLGTTYLAWRFGFLPYASAQPTLISQIASYLFVGPFAWFYYVIQVATLLVLVLAANTSFADFPRLSSILARDGFLPHLFGLRGDRLAFTTGIIVLSALSIVLLVVFAGNTDALIQLYALGVFTAFTLSQSGMVVRWYRLRGTAGRGWLRAMVVNAIGAITTLVVAVIILITKFDHGAWIVVVLVPVFVLMFKGIAKHYARVTTETQELTPLRAEEMHNIAIVPIARLNRPGLQSLAYARSLTPEVIAVHISAGEADDATLREEWTHWVESRKDVWAALASHQPGSGTRAVTARGRDVAAAVAEGPQLVVIESPYRSLLAPLVVYVDAVRDENPGATISVILPEFVPAHWWERLLHNQTALRLKLAMYRTPGVIVTNVPYHLKA